MVVTRSYASGLNDGQWGNRGRFPWPKPHHEDVGSLTCFSPRSCEGSALAAIGERLLGHRKS